MPLGDGTGPRGYGPMTGRAAGYCAGYNVPGYANPVGGRGFGRGFGWGRGWGRGRGFGRGWGRGWGFGRGYGYYDPVYYPPPTYAPAVTYEPGVAPVYQAPSPDQERTYLERLVKDLEQELEDVKSRIKELAKESKK
jgi:hypothetical protein